MSANTDRMLTGSPDECSHEHRQVQDFFLEQVSRTPGRPAVICGRRTLSYQELETISGFWAARLQQLAVGRHNLVAIVMDKGWEQVAAVLGILGAGAACLPIDPNIPQERLWYLLKDSGARVVLTQSAVDSRHHWPEGIERFCLDTESVSSSSMWPTPDALRSPDDLVYVLYTSGSTGFPKGVMIGHRGLVNCIVDTIRCFGIDSQDRILAITALHHDMSMFDIFGLLAVGGCIVIPGPAENRAPDRWADLIDSHAVTIWNSVPGFMQMMLEHAGARDLHLPGRLRLAFLGGDWIPLSMPRQIQQHFGDVQVVSVGGPTETTLWNIWYPIERVDPRWKSIPYGHPISKTRYFVLDDELRDCAQGVGGELWCAGPGLMKGYWKDEAQTRERFATHRRTGDRIYRTGDRGSLRADGEIEFLGRADLQIKINGLRIELGEIEIVLGRAPGILRAVVNPVQQGLHKKLAAYFVPERETFVDVSALKSFLQERLPQYMIPTDFVCMETLPINSNGKLDRNALPVPKTPSPREVECFVTDSANPADIITTVWCEVLGLSRVDRDQNFFDLGGNSLRLVEAHAELEKRLGRQISIADLFEFPTVDTLARFLTSSAPERIAVSDLETRANRRQVAMARQRQMARIARQS